MIQAQPDASPWDSRIVGHGRVAPDQITLNPLNFRKHPAKQRQALADAIAEVGFIRSVTVNKRTGNLIDGHERVCQALNSGQPTIDVEYVDLSPDDERKALATLDPISEMAEVDPEQLEKLLAEVETGSDALTQMLAELASDAGLHESNAIGSVFSNEQIVESAFEWFRKTGFPGRNLPRHVCMQEINDLAATDDDSLRGTHCGYHVADTYNPHRFYSSAEGMKSPATGFGDDKLLRRAITLAVDDGYTVPAGYFSQLSMVSGVQACSNFRPGFALLLYRRFAPAGATVLDTSTGYGGRLVGFMASGLAKYIGIDPNTKTHAGNLKMADELGFADRVELHNLPAEDVPHELLANRCDFAFTSPPYFRKEHYSDEATQSWKRYGSGDSWRDGFLAAMLRLQFAALKPGCRSIVNIADVTIKGKLYPLAEWTAEAAVAAGFTHEKTEEFPLQRRYGAEMSDEVATEPVLIFRKPT